MKYYKFNDGWFTYLEPGDIEVPANLDDFFPDEDTYEYIKEDTMIRASRYNKLSKKQVLDEFHNKGLMAVYDLGLSHMYDYLNKNTKGENK